MSLLDLVAGRRIVEAYAGSRFGGPVLRVSVGWPIGRASMAGGVLDCCKGVYVVMLGKR